MRPTFLKKLAHAPKNVRHSSGKVLKRFHSFKRVSFFLAVAMLACAALATFVVLAVPRVAPGGPCVSPATVYVDDSWFGTLPGADPDGVGPATNFGCDSFATIQDGVNGVFTGGTVNVRAGTYAESVLVNKAATLLGAQAGQNANTRFAAFIAGGPPNGPKADPLVESVITAAVVDPNTNVNNTVHVMADNVTVDGFVVDGNNPALSPVGAVVVGGINTDSRRGIQTETAAGVFFPANNVTVRYNVIQNFAQRGVQLINGNDSATAPATSGSMITQNLVRNFGVDGIVLFFNAHADITNNTVVTNDFPTEAGIWVQDFLNVGPTFPITIANNNVTVGDENFGGIWVNLAYLPDLNINNNTVHAAPGVTGASDFTFGIYLSSQRPGSDASLTGNIVGSSGGVFSRGISLWNLGSATPTTVTGGTVSNSLKGVSLHDNDPNFGLAGANSEVETSGVSIDGAGVPADVGIFVDAAGSTGDTVGMEIFGDTSITNTTTAISVVGANASSHIHDNSASIHDNTTGIDVNGGSANINNNNLFANATGLRFANAATGTANFNRIISTTTAIDNPNNLTLNLENNWWGCNAGPGNAGCGAVTGAGADFNPWIVLGVSAAPNSILLLGSSTVTADMTHNSDAVVPMGTLPDISVAFSATQGTMAPPSGTITAGLATSTFTSTSTSSGTGCATVDNQLICTPITVLQTTVTITPALTPTAGDNDYTRINTAIQSSVAGQTIILDGTFDWTEANAAASWALGSDGVASTADDYSILVPVNLNNVTFTANNLGDGTIKGPGDLAGINLEGVLVFDGGDNQDWTISNIQFIDFDLAIGMFNGAGGVDAFNNTHITNNHIRIASDLNATVAPADVNQNIGIHYSFGTNQVISGNTIDIQGNAISAGSNFASDVGMQSNTSGGNAYDGLQITNNIIHVLNAQSADPQVILGIWENASGHLSNITVSGNQFTNQAAGNNSAINLQRAFRVTSHSSATTTVIYQSNTVTGANIGFQWLAGSNFAGNQPVQLTSNTITGNGTGVLVQSQGSANLSVNRIVGNTVTGLNNFDGTATAENNWWGCNAGPGNAGCDTVMGTVDSDPWLVLGVSASPNPILQGGTSTVTADMTHNSVAADTSGSGTVPLTTVAFSATEGTIAPPTGTITAGQASSTFTSTSANSGTGCATVDNQLTCANITVRPLVVTIIPTPSPTAVDNDYTRINNAVQASISGQTIILNGLFNWAEPNAAASWALGSNGLAGDIDDYSVYPPANLNNVTFTAANLGAATIQGPGDLAVFDLEGVFFFDGGDNQNWTISNIRFLDFDNAIGMYFGVAGGADAFNNTHIINNYIRVANDLNATVAPADVFQNIGIHYAHGSNQVISGNTIDLQGDGVSDSANSNFSTEVGMQCNTSGGAVYDGLQITNNTIHVLNAQSANPEVIRGIWENAHAHSSNITVSGNSFTNLALGNNPATNLQRGFRVTSHSSLTTTVVYENNTVTGANIGFQWLEGSNFAGNLPVQLTSNTITGNGTGVVVQSQGLASLSFNRIVGNPVTGLNNVDGTATAENNWWGCNAGPGSTGCDTVTGTADSNPWLVLGVSAVASTINSGGSSTATADMTHNSDAADPSGSDALPLTPVAFSATQGTMSPPLGTITAGQATSTFTSTSGSSGTACAMVDNQLICEPIAVNAPSFTIDDVVHNEGDSGTTAYTFTVTKTGSTLLNATVNYTTVDGSATSPSDFTAIPTTTLTFLPADTTKQFTVFVNGDTTVEADETFSVSLSSPTNATIADGLGQGTITTDDTDVTVAVSPSSVAEDGATNLVYTFTRNGVTSGSLTMNFSVGGTATFGTDYTQTGATTFGATIGTVTFGAGNSTTTVTVDPSSDITTEPDDTVILTVTSGTGYNVGSPSSATGTITNDDTDVSVAVAPSAVAEDGATNLVYTFTRSGITAGALTANFSVAGTATFGTDYTQTGAASFGATTGTVTFGAGNATAAVTIDPTADLAFEPDETVILTVTSGAGYNVGSPSSDTGTIINDDASGGIIRFSSATFNTTENSGSVTITVERVGDTTGAATVDYATPDDSEAPTVVPCATVNGFASPRCDFTTALGTLRFAAGETSKTFAVLISQDNYVEGPETLTLTLSNLTGGAVFGVPSTATLTIDDDVTEPTQNPIDDAANFVRQHYHDFLNREPDPAGLAFWTNEITLCGADPQCIEAKRINVSAAFYLSIEFQDTGYFVERLYKSSYGDATGMSTNGGAHTLPVPIVRFSEFLPDTQEIGQGVIVGQTGWEAVLEANKVAFTERFVQRSRFTTAYPNTLTPAEFVDMLFANAGVAPTSTQRQAAIDEFGGAGTSANVAARGRALRLVSENGALVSAEFNRAFVLMQYFGYLRRNPNV
ncbi:MAG: hypothetical protein ND895_23535, partial [Pyrinomonadaceae bacterium]|nr:hypothetical protein [Pyrinomonadaceae bacterium]